jgi:hypothetical protein
VLCLFFFRLWRPFASEKSGSATFLKWPISDGRSVKSLNIWPESIQSTNERHHEQRFMILISVPVSDFFRSL